jgi:hypothetical protein
MYFKIGDKDFSSLVSSLKVGKETLVSDESGRNANGDMVIDIVNKKRKVYVGLRHTTAEEMAEFLAATESYVVNATFLDPHTRQMHTIRAYIGTPEPEYYTIQPGHVLCKPMNLNFIEL